MFKWQWSDWGSNCPVSMQEGEYVTGDPHFAVKFMNKIFYLKNEEAYLKFFRNPRPYLLPPNPRSRCRIFIMGPNHSGKTLLAKCLGTMLKAQVLNPMKLQKKYFSDKVDKFREKLRNNAIAEALQILEEQEDERRAQKEEERMRKIAKWIQDIMSAYEDYLALDMVYSDDAKQMAESRLSLTAFSSFAVKMKKSSKSDLDDEEVRYNKLKEKFKKRGLPTDSENIEALKQNPEVRLVPFLPAYLKSVTASAVDVNHPFVQGYVEKILRETRVHDKRHDMSVDNVVEMFTEAINAIEETNQQNENLHGGWIVDGMPVDLELFQAISQQHIADDILYLDDSDTDFRFLINRYEKLDTEDASVNIADIFSEVGLKDFSCRYSIVHETEMFAESVIQDIINDAVPDEDVEEKKELKQRQLEEYKESLEINQRNWHEVSEYLHGINKSPVIINISNKDTTDVLHSVLANVLDQFRQTASVFTESDRMEEMEDFAPTKSPMLGEEEEGEEGNEEGGEGNDDSFFENRRFGETFIYCPVTFHDHFILCRGKEEHTVKFMNKLYFLHNEKSMNEFLKYPRRYVNLNKIQMEFPPPRIFVVGRKKSGKTALSKLLARNFGLYYVNFDRVILDAADNPAKNFEECDDEAIQAYLEGAQPLPEEFLRTFIDRVFFKEPIKSLGFVVDGFPRRPSDVEFMEIDGTVPDIILELSVTDEIRYERIVNETIVEWKSRRQAVELENAKLLTEWQKHYKAKLQELLEVAKTERYHAKVQEKLEKRGLGTEENAEPVGTGEWDTKSQVSYGSVQEEEDLQRAEALAQQELPLPEFEDVSETEEEARQRLFQQVQSEPDNDMQFLKSVRDFCDSELIKWSVIDANYPLDKLIMLCVRECEDIKFRNDSIFERCYDITFEIAEKLLETGYCFLSKFGYTCPVQVYKKRNFIQMYIPAEQRGDLFPIINRNYVYFIVGAENRDQFKKDPLKYILNKQYHFPLVSAKFAVVGPPKCGKTTLAERFRRDLGLKVISRGAACRYVLKVLNRSSLKKRMEYTLRQGWELTDDMVMDAVDALCMDGRAITQGFVFDGFPNNEDEMTFLASLGLTPQLILYMNASENVLEEFRRSEKTHKGMLRQFKYRS